MGDAQHPRAERRAAQAQHASKRHPSTIAMPASQQPLQRRFDGGCQWQQSPLLRLPTLPISHFCRSSLVRELQQHSYGYHCSLGEPKVDSSTAWNDEIWVHRPSMPGVLTTPRWAQVRQCGHGPNETSAGAAQSAQTARAPLHRHPRHGTTGSPGLLNRPFQETKQRSQRVQTDRQRIESLIDSD